LGQKSFGETACDTCGMVYFPGNEEDEQLHRKYHKKNSNKTLDFKGWKNERVVKEFTDKSRILMVQYDDPVQHVSKISEVVSIMDKELGYVQSSNTRKDKERVFIMINGNKKVIGCAIVEPIRNAFPLVADNEHGSPPHSTEEINKEPVRCSKVSQPAVCGVSRIWVHSSERRKGVASKLLDAVRSNFIFGYNIPKNKCAFTQPTQDGRRFFARYTNTENFLVYSPKTRSE